MAIYSLSTSPTTTVSIRSTPELSLSIFHLCRELSEPPFYKQVYGENIEQFYKLYSLNKDFLSLEQYKDIFEAFASFPFAGNYQCFHLVIEDLEEKYPNEIQAFKERYLLPRSFTPNFFSMERILYIKGDGEPLPIEFATIDKIKEVLKNFFYSEEVKQGFLLLHQEESKYHYFPLLSQKVSDRLYIGMTDSVVVNSRLSRVIAAVKELSETIPCSFYHYPISRQVDWHTCPYFAMNDAIQFLRTRYFFDVAPSENRCTVELINRLPDKMMKFTQFYLRTISFHSPDSFQELHPDLKMRRYTSGEENLHAEVKETKYLSYLLLDYLESHITGS